MYSCKKYVIEIITPIVCVILFCEYIIYYVVLIQCGWSQLDANKVDVKIKPATSEERPVNAMFIADTHLLGSRNGHWFDRLRREWQMYRSFQTMMILHKPDIVFVLGDLFDEGLWCSSTEFEEYTMRFRSLFSVPRNSHLYVVAGNHDMGFHYGITSYLNKRFVSGMKAPSVRRIHLRGNHFVLINSMALEGDGCFLCKSTQLALKKIAGYLRCAKYVDIDCPKNNTIIRYSRPIILQHYPMYRESDEMCNEIDQAPNELKNLKFRERWECLSKEASEQLLNILNPRLIVNGHTHHGCRRLHRHDIMEFTIPSFSWRNKNNPSILLGVFTPNNYSVSKCYIPIESTIIGIYVSTVLCLIIYSLLRCKQKSKNHIFLKIQ